MIMVTYVSREILKKIVIALVPIHSIVASSPLDRSASRTFVQEVPVSPTVNVIESTERHKTVSSSPSIHVFASGRAVACVRTICAHNVRACSPMSAVFVTRVDR